MQKVKIFKSIESELINMENEINQWIAETGARVISITGNIAPQSARESHGGAFSDSDVLIVILYDQFE